MANFFFHGAVSDSLTLAGNYTGGVAPTGLTTDAIYVSADAQRGILSNVVQPTWDIASFEVQRGFRHAIGSSTSKLTFGCGSFIDRGDGELWLDSNGPAVGIDEIIIDKDELGSHVYLYDSGEQIVQLDHMRGHTHYRCINGGTVNVTYRSMPSADSYLHVDGAAGTTGATLVMNGGHVQMDQLVFNNIDQWGGSIEMNEAFWGGIGIGAHRFKQMGGLARWIAIPSSYANMLLGIYEGRGGVLDVSASPTRMNCDFSAWPGWSLIDDLSSPKFNVDYPTIGR